MVRCWLDWRRLNASSCTCQVGAVDRWLGSQRGCGSGHPHVAFPWPLGPRMAWRLGFRSECPVRQEEAAVPSVTELQKSCSSTSAVLCCWTLTKAPRSSSCWGRGKALRCTVATSGKYSKNWHLGHCECKRNNIDRQ